jgi:hypothetical protein
MAKEHAHAREGLSCHKLVAAPGLLAHACVTEVVKFCPMGPKLRYTAVPGWDNRSVRVCVRARACAYVRDCVRAHACVRVCVFVFMCICVAVCVCVLQWVPRQPRAQPRQRVPDLCRSQLKRHSRPSLPQHPQLHRRVYTFARRLTQPKHARKHRRLTQRRPAHKCRR